MEIIEQLYSLCNNIEYSRDIPNQAKKLAADNGFIVIVGGSDDLMYCYGAESYMTDYCEHGYGWDGETFESISDKKLQNEANQLGLKIWWCGKIFNRNEDVIAERSNYDQHKMGAFSYTVNSEIQHKEFTVLERGDTGEVYCTGIIVKLPESFQSFK